jgi:dUTP pyrophosphatase
MKELKFKRLDSQAVLPTRTNATDAGLDLYAMESVRIYESDYETIPIGIAVEIPEGYYGRIAPRSGLAAKYGLDVLAGVIDASYRGEIKVIVSNYGLGSGDYITINPGDRIAQLIIEKIEVPVAVWADELDDTARSAQGFGSSGR